MVKLNLRDVPEPMEFYPWDVMLNQGFHWMDTFGDAHWIPDMDTSYLHNALRFAKIASRRVSTQWWSFAMILNGEMATELAMETAEKYDECDVPLVKGLENEIAHRKGDFLPFDRWELEGNDWTMYMEQKGMEHDAAIRTLGGR